MNGFRYRYYQLLAKIHKLKFPHLILYNEFIVFAVFYTKKKQMSKLFSLLLIYLMLYLLQLTPSTVIASSPLHRHRERSEAVRPVDILGL